MEIHTIFGGKSFFLFPNLFRMVAFFHVQVLIQFKWKEIKSSHLKLITIGQIKNSKSFLSKFSGVKENGK